MLRPVRFRPVGRGSLIGTSERFYQIFGAPQHRDIFANIVLFLWDDLGRFGPDISSLSLSCCFLFSWTQTALQVDTPSVELADSPLSLASSSVPPDVGDW